MTVAPTPTPIPTPTATTYYVDCSAPTAGGGTSSSPLNSLSAVNATSFTAGDQILFKRGMTCSGIFMPTGSGSSGYPIVVDAYGTGAQPIIDGGTNYAAMWLTDQQYWEVNNLELVGGNKYGLLVAGSATGATLTHLHFTNLDVHGAHYVSTTRTDSGLVYIYPNGANEVMNDVVLDGVTAHDSQVSEGIMVGGGSYASTWQNMLLGDSLTIRNSTAHDVYGDGILLLNTNNGLMENNVVYHSGLCPNCGANGGSTPGGLWEWFCHTCTVQNNESYANSSWGQWDGGDFDIDYHTTNNIVQYNYGHDTVGYCVSIFGAENDVTTGAIIRYNICSNNSQMTASQDVGEIVLNTWDGGTIDGAQIYNNTFNFNTVTPGPLLVSNNATFSGTAPVFFKNNVVYSSTPLMTVTGLNFVTDYNIYWIAGNAAPQWTANWVTYTGAAAMQATGNDVHSLFADPLLNTATYHATGKPVLQFTPLAGSPTIGAGTNVCTGIANCTMGTQDFFGNPIPGAKGYDIGAYQSQ